MSNISKGKYGENLACEYLKNCNYKITDRNYRYSKYGEIDIIALSPDDELCFIEVKTRVSEKFGTALEAITKEKLFKIFTCTKNYTANVSFKYKRVRIDAISVDLSTDPPKIEHVKNLEIN